MKRRRSCSTRSRSTRRASWSTRLLPAAAGDGAVVAGRRARGRQPVLRRGDGAAAGRGERRRRPPSLPDTVQALLAARLDSLEPDERRLVQHAAVVGRTFWEGSLSQIVAEAGTDSEDELARAADLAAGEGHRRPGRRRAARRRARVRLQARPDPRRRLRDAAEVRPLREALRGRPVHRGARRRAHRRGRGAAGRALRSRGVARARRPASSTTRSSRSTARRCTSWRRPATPPPRSTPTPRPSTTTSRRASCAPATTPPRSRASARSRATSPCGMGRVDAAIVGVGGVPRVPPPRRRT